MIALCVVTDGRADCLAETLDNVHKLGSFDRKFITDDSGDIDYANWLRCNYPDFTVIHHSERRGMAGAVQSAWNTVLDSGAEYAFHLEDDFVVNDTVELAPMVDFLEAKPWVAQMLLKRQPLAQEEIEADDILGGMGPLVEFGDCVTQMRIFSLNPCVLPRRTLEVGWPAGNEAEFTQILLSRDCTFGVWGAPGSRPLVSHIGNTRSAGWRL